MKSCHITAAEKYPNINLKFNKKLCGGKVEQGETIFVEYVDISYFSLDTYVLTSA